MVVDQKEDRKNWWAEGEERHKGLLTPPQKKKRKKESPFEFWGQYYASAIYVKYINNLIF
jgi:hypothetical protein